MLLVITVWARDRINNLHLGRKTIEKGTQSTKISVLIGTDHKISTTDFDSALSMELVTPWKAAGTAAAGRLCAQTCTLQEPAVLAHICKGAPLFITGICSREIIGQRVCFCYRAGLHIHTDHLWDMHNLAPNAIVKARKTRYRKVEMCLG